MFIKSLSQDFDYHFFWILCFFGLDAECVVILHVDLV